MTRTERINSFDQIEDLAFQIEHQVAALPHNVEIVVYFTQQELYKAYEHVFPEEVTGHIHGAKYHAKTGMIFDVKTKP